jgi:hypothetical protein
MKNFLLLSMILLLSSTTILFGQAVMIDDFDASDTGVYELVVEGPASSILLSTNTADKMQGTGSMDMNAVIGAFNPWGSYAQLVYRTDSTEVLDWSVIGDSLSIWIKIRNAPTMPANMVFRMHLADRPTPNDPIEEYLYENPIVLDAVGDWYQLKIPLVVREQSGGTTPDSTGFILPPDNWGFARNNFVLDRDKIVGYNLALVTTTGAADSLIVGFDAFERFGVRAVPFIFFNGRVVSNFLDQFTWGQSSLEVEEGTGSQAGKNSLKWTQGNEWGNGYTGAGWNITTPLNMSGSWAVDSLKFKMKAPAGTGPIRFQFESGPNGKVGYIFTPIGDDQWHQYSFALSDFVPQEGTTEFDSSAVIVFQFLAEGSGEAGRVIYMDDLWTGNPVIDVIDPTQVLNVSVSSGTFLNTITWDDVIGEAGETYSVYYSNQVITDVTAPGVEVVKLKIAENTGLVDHVLIAPATNQNVTYYYAVVCVDAAGNQGPVSDPTPPLTTLAKGVTVIHPSAPTNFAADGDLSDWTGIVPFRMFVSDGTGTVVTNTTITNDADLSVLAYVAMDNDYLYVAFDVTDDVVSADTTQQSYLIDSPDLFIGLYDWHGAPHTSYRRGAEPDYHYRFGRNAILQDNSPGGRLLEQGDPNYYWDERFSPPGYVVEAKISFAEIAALGGDDLFTPIIGKRIPIDFAVNDNDTPGSDLREGILTYSPNNQDQSWNDVSRWVHTWIGDQWVVGVEDENDIVKSYNLFQNYPNPFNPLTQISYSLEKSGFVSLKIYDLLGREVVTLVNTEQSAGTYTVQFDASRLASGIYFYKIESGSFVKTNKMVLMK